MELQELKQEIMEVATIGALALLRQQNPAFDEVKLKEAYLIAGSQRWLRHHIRKGNIKPIRRGTAKNSPVYYSRLEIAALKKAERELYFNNEKNRKK